MPFVCPLTGVGERSWFGAPFLSMNHRLLILAAGSLALLANICALVLNQSGPPNELLLPLANAVSIAATFGILAAATLSSNVKPAEPITAQPAALEPAAPLIAATLADLASPDDPLNNKPLMQLVEECVLLFDELDRLRPGLEASTQDFADHVASRVQEILERCGATIISGDLTFDHRRHQQETTDPLIADGSPIAETQSPGFAVGRRVFRRARVKLTENATTEKGANP